MSNDLDFFNIEEYNKCYDFINKNFNKISTTKNEFSTIKKNFLYKYIYVQECNNKMLFDLLSTGQIEDSRDILKRIEDLKKKYVFFEKNYCFLMHISNITDIILNNNRGDIFDKLY